MQLVALPGNLDKELYYVGPVNIIALIGNTPHEKHAHLYVYVCVCVCEGGGEILWGGGGEKR